MEIIEERHGRASTLIASQLPVKAWHDLIGEPTFADAILDRIVHNAYRLDLEGQRSMREPAAAGELHEPTTATPMVSNGKAAKGARK
jgi:DNA replication protein DnaC